MIFQMAKTVLKTLLSGPATLMYPLKPAKKSKDTRGHLENDINKCIFCGTCQRKCPCVAITVDRLAQTWALDRYRCISCNCCVEVCPAKCLRMETDYTAPGLGPNVKVLLKPDKPYIPPGSKTPGPPWVMNPSSQKSAATEAKPDSNTTSSQPKTEEKKLDSPVP